MATSPPPERNTSDCDESAKFQIKVDIDTNTTEASEFGRFKDPRAALRSAIEQRRLISADDGSSSKKSIPISTGGSIQKVGATYAELKSKHLAAGTLFEDEDFPAKPESIFFSQSVQNRLTWKRPKEICQNPKFISDGTSRFDVRQGQLGDCWLLAAVANLSLNEDLLEQVMPSDQDFTHDYCGIFRFHFWRFGEWVEVVIDDRLPVNNDTLVFMHSTDKNEFWSALLEKAYAKLFGSYETLKGGSTIEALEDFTGGLSEFFDLKGKQPLNLDKIMWSAYERHSLMACSIEANPNVVEARQSNGLIKGHAYSITRVATVKYQDKDVLLVRVRNPWGNEAEWTGRWSDKSSEWSGVDEQQKKELGLTFDADGEFWMSYEDFVLEFEKLEICCLGPQSLSETSSTNKITFQMTLENGSWQPGVSAGGCRNFLESFWTNPQFRIHVEDADDNDDEDKGTLIIGLMQKNRRKLRNVGGENLTIGFMVYLLKEDVEGPLDVNFFKYNAAVARSTAFINTREVTGRFRLSPGHYVIVPSTYQKNEKSDFLLRIFSEKIRTTQQMDDRIGMDDVATASKPEPMNTAQVEALRRAFEKVAGADACISSDELVDILNVAFTKELSDTPAIVETSPKPEPQRTTRRLLCCVAPPRDKPVAKKDETKPATKKDFAFEGFSLESCRSLIAMMDVDRSGSLDFDEFKSLWEMLRLWKTAFKKFDADKNGTMSSFELRLALNAVGFHIDNATFSSLVLRFSNRDGVLHFDEYIMCCARLRTAFETISAGRAIEYTDNQLLNILIYL